MKYLSIFVNLNNKQYKILLEYKNIIKINNRLLPFPNIK